MSGSGSASTLTQCRSSLSSCSYDALLQIQRGDTVALNTTRSMQLRETLAMQATDTTNKQSESTTFKPPREIPQHLRF